MHADPHGIDATIEDVSSCPVRRIVLLGVVALLFGLVAGVAQAEPARIITKPGPFSGWTSFSGTSERLTP